MKVHKTNNRTKYPFIQLGVVAHWGSYQKEAGVFNYTRHDLHEFLHNMLDNGGCDNDLMKGENVDPDEVRTEHTLQQDGWYFYSNARAAWTPFTS